MDAYSVGRPTVAEVGHLLASLPNRNGAPAEFQHPPTVSDRDDIYDNAAFEHDLTESSSSSNQMSKETNSANTCQADDALVYANLSEIARRKELEDIDRQPNPPYPDASAQPLRIIANGWQEYRTLGGRSYYFHPQKGICQWKPPRSTTASYNFMRDDVNVLSAPHDCLASTSAEMSSTEFFAEIPLHRELRTACNNVENPVQVHFIRSDESFVPASKGMMSHSLDSSIGNNNEAANTHPQHQQSDDLIGQSDSGSTHYDTPANIAAQNREMAIRHGFLEKCKIAENGSKLRRRDWCNSYAYLFTGHFLFYKDQKSAEKIGKHYPPPSDVCDLRNAAVCYADNDKFKDKRRKHVISLVLLSKTEYLFCCCGEEIVAWFNAIRHAITSTPTQKLHSNTIISEYCGSLSRSSLRNKRDSGPFASKTNFHNSIKYRLKSSSSSKAFSDDRMSVTEASTVESNHPTKESIIEKLLRFFRSRPSMESLRERGIYKPEPVFGSTLSDICSREKSLIPRFIIEVTQLIEEKGLDSDGLYRVNGNLSAVQRIRCQIDQDQYDVMRHEEDIHVLTGSLKLFLRELAEPVFPVCVHKDYMSSMRESGIKRLRVIDDLLIRLPPINRETLRVLIQHLSRVATHSGKNRMQTHNLAIIFGPSLFCSEDRPRHLRKSSQDKGKGGRRKSADKKFPEETIQSEPTQNLAYRMIVYGQIVEYILNEMDRLTIFKASSQQQASVVN